MPRLCSEKQACEELGLDTSTFRHLVARGRLPEPLPEIGKFDIKAIHASLDAMSGLGPEYGGRPGNPLDAWKQKREMRHAD
jgi:hypothetical protein